MSTSRSIQKGTIEASGSLYRNNLVITWLQRCWYLDWSWLMETNGNSLLSVLLLLPSNKNSLHLISAQGLRYSHHPVPLQLATAEDLRGKESARFHLKGLPRVRTRRLEAGACLSWAEGFETQWGFEGEDSWAILRCINSKLDETCWNWKWSCLKLKLCLEEPFCYERVWFIVVEGFRGQNYDDVFWGGLCFTFWCIYLGWPLVSPAK